MAIRVAINGFGRMGRLALRVLVDSFPHLEVVQINEHHGTAETAAHLLTFDSIHGIWQTPVCAEEHGIRVNGTYIGMSQRTDLALNWDQQQIDMVLECTGAYRSPQALAPYFAQGVKKVVVACPVKAESRTDAFNVVYGVNDHLYDPALHHLLTAASCTTNCLAPVVKVLHEQIGIRHGAMTTIHSSTNTQSVVDTAHKDLRRARAHSQSLIPTSTGSASAITMIYPELAGKLNGLAVRVPLLHVSLVDCVFELQQAVSVEEINGLFQTAADTYLQGILGYEERPLVSVDYTNDTRSGIIDALSTMVIDDTCVKVLAWYDNEIGYVNRMVELADKVAQLL